MDDSEKLAKTMADTAPKKLRDLSIETMQACSDYLSDALSNIPGDNRALWRYRDRIELLRREIEMRRIENRSEHQHRELFGKAKWTLFWAAVGGATGIVLVLIAAWPLVRDTFFSKAQPSTSPQPSLETPLQSQSTTSVSPEPEASASISTPSPQPTATTTPSTSTPVLRKNRGDHS